MLDIENIYVFDAQSALYLAEHTSQDEQIIFYDGEELDNAPKNCINVPLDNFAQYFLTSEHAYPEQLNFDNMNFSEEIINTIISSLTDTLSKVKEQRVHTLYSLLGEELSEKNADKTLYAILEHIKINKLFKNDLNFELVYKLAEANEYISSHLLSLNPETESIVQESIRTVESLKNPSHSLYIFTTKYILHLLNKTDVEEAQKKFFKALASFANLQQLIDDFAIIKLLFPENRLEEYIISLGDTLFGDEFWKLETLQQKQKIFTLYYLKCQIILSIFIIIPTILYWTV